MRGRGGRRNDVRGVDLDVLLLEEEENEQLKTRRKRKGRRKDGGRRKRGNDVGGAEVVLEEVNICAKMNPN